MKLHENIVCIEVEYRNIYVKERERDFPNILSVLIKERIAWIYYQYWGPVHEFLRCKERKAISEHISRFKCLVTYTLTS